MSWVVLHVQYFENKIVEDIGVSKDEQAVGYSFLLSKKIKLTSQSFWCTKHLQKNNWSLGHEKHTELEKF